MYVCMYIWSLNGKVQSSPPRMWLATRCSVPTLYLANESEALTILPIQLHLFRPGAIQRTPCWVINFSLVDLF